MANKKISDLAAATLITNEYLFEVANAASASLKATQDQIRARMSGLQDSVVFEEFDDYAVGAITSFNQGVGWGGNVGVCASGGSIISSTMADGRTHNRLQLANGSYGRKMPWGALWNRIRVCMAIRINGGANISNTLGYLGVCAGTANMSDSATTANFVGVRWDGTGLSTFTAGTKISFFDVPTARAVTKIAAGATDRGGLSSGHSVSANAGYLSYQLIDISRPVFANDASSINYSVAEATTNNIKVQFSGTKDLARIIAMDEVTTNLANGTADTTILGAAGVTAAPFAFDQSAGALDTINIFWSHAATPMEVAAFCVRKVQ